MHADNSRHEIIQLFSVKPSKVRVVPHGSNILFVTTSKEEARKRPGIPSDKKVILFFRLIKSYEGLEYLLQAFGEITDSVQKLMLLIAERVANEERAIYDYYAGLLSQFGEQ